MLQVNRRYSETQGREAIDWNQRIKAMIEGLVTKNSVAHKNFVRDSGSWVTCACGNMCSIIPRYPTMQARGISVYWPGTPVDVELRTLGNTFHDNITDFQPKEAAETLERIEKRSEFLIKEILKENATAT